jgi:lipopolysaccharide export system protein LptA
VFFNNRLKFTLTFSALIVLAATLLAESKEIEVKSGFPGKESNLPTFIDSDNLSVETTTREFSYRGNVRVTQGDMVLTSDSLKGKYDANNKIDTLTALGKVVITKGEEGKGEVVQAKSERALYDAKARTVTLTENPEVVQAGSILTADVVRVYLDSNKSVAEGRVRVKLVNEGEKPKL